MNKTMQKFCDKKKEHPDHYEVIHKHQIDMTPFTILLGPNGTGKSMSLRHLEKELDDAGQHFVRFNTANHDVVNSDMSFRPERLISAWNSEGERLRKSIVFWAGDYIVKELLSHKMDLYILIDQIDSGLSLDKMAQVLDDLFYLYLAEQKKHPRRKLRFIFTANSYEFVNLMYYYCEIKAHRIGEILMQIYWVPTRSLIKRINSYDDFAGRYIEYYKYMKEIEYGE